MKISQFLVTTSSESTMALSKPEPFSFESTLQNDGLAVTTEERTFLTNTALTASVSIKV